MRGLFVTGTDTDCGKTRVSVALIHALRDKGLRVAPFKPVAAGAAMVDEGLRNDDALQLMAAAGGQWSYARVNPYCLQAAVSPHLAAAVEGVTLQTGPIREALQVLAEDADVLLVEGAGGWMVPLREDWCIEDLALELGLPVVLVIGLRLGCLNHARLSEARIRASGAHLAGWIGSVVDPAMDQLEGNLRSLENLLASPCLGVLPHLQPAEHGARYLDVRALDAVLRSDAGSGAA